MSAAAPAVTRLTPTAELPHEVDMAVDLGSTSVQLRTIDTRTGIPTGEVSVLNKQVRRGHDVMTRLTAEIRKALASPALIERYKGLDTEIDGGTPEEFAALARREQPKWAAVIRRANVRVD